MSDKGSKCNRRGRTIKKPEKYCTTDSDKPPSKKKAKSNILQKMTAMFSNSNSEESTDARSQSSDNEYNFSTDSENNVEMKKGSQKAAQSARKEERNQDKPIAKPGRKKEGNQEKTLQPTSEQQLRHHGNNNLNLSDCSAQTLQNNYDQGTLQPTSEQQLRHHGNNNLNLSNCSAQTLQNNYDQGTLQPTSEQQLRHHGNNNFNLPGSTQTLQNNYDQGYDVKRTSNNHSVYDFNSGSVVETSTVQNNSSRTCNKYISPTVTSNNRFYDSSSTSGMYANAASVPPTYTQGLYVSGTALDNTHIHPQLYNYRNNNDGHINYNDSENAILNNLRSLQESFFQKCKEKMDTFCKTQEQYVSKKVDAMQSYNEKKMDELKTYFDTKLDNLQINANNNDRARPVYSLPEGFPLQNMQEFKNFERDEQKQKELRNYFIWWGNPNTKIALRQYIRNSISDELASHFKWAQKSNKENNEESENEENEPASHRTLYDTQLSKMMFHANESFHKNTDENNRPKSPSIKKRLKRSRFPLNPVNLDDIENKPPEKKIGWDCWECREYYKNLSLKEDLQKRKNQCSRHRHKYERPNTPEGFWDPVFPDTSSD